MNPEELILICAVRYALGRMSYIVGEVCQYVMLSRKKLSKECINIIIRDVEEELERFHVAGSYLGMECDEKEWTKLLTVLKNERHEEVDAEPEQPQWKENVLQKFMRSE